MSNVSSFVRTLGPSKLLRLLWFISSTTYVTEGERVRLNMREARSGGISFIRKSSRVLLVSGARVREDGLKRSWSEDWIRRRRARRSRRMYQKRRKEMAPNMIMPIMVAAAMDAWLIFRVVFAFAMVVVLLSEAGESVSCEVVSFQKRCSTSFVSFWDLIGIAVSLVSVFSVESVCSARVSLTFNICRGGRCCGSLVSGGGG